MTRAELFHRLETLHGTIHDPRFIHPDPLETVLRYTSPRDQEIVGLIAATLAYGRASQILVSIDRVLKVMGHSPSDFTQSSTPDALTSAFKGFQHRWTTAEDIANLILGMQRSIQSNDSLEKGFAMYISTADKTTLPALSKWIPSLNDGFPKNSLLSNPAAGSACKRLHLYLRWMVRKDTIDPGPWSGISPALLVIPLDTHMFRFASRHRMTRRKSPDGKAALEMTSAFRKMCPDDPLKFDFTLTRLGIHPDLSPELFDLV